MARRADNSILFRRFDERLSVKEVWLHVERHESRVWIGQPATRNSQLGVSQEETDGESF
jgi:hypothetical protein